MICGIIYSLLFLPSFSLFLSLPPPLLPPSFIPTLSPFTLPPSLPLCRVRLCTHVVVVPRYSLPMWKYSDTPNHRHQDHEDQPGNRAKVVLLPQDTTSLIRTNKGVYTILFSSHHWTYTFSLFQSASSDSCKVSPAR